MPKDKIKKLNGPRTQAQIDAYQAKIRKATGKGGGTNDFLIEDEILFKALGPVWTYILKEAIRVGARNILGITAKSTRKTGIVKFIQHYLLARHKWLQAKDLRRTKELSNNVLTQSHLDAMKHWAEEYGLPWLRTTITQGAGKLFFVRDKKSKNNQTIEFSSFDGIASEGGFTKPYVFHWEELVDPDSKGKAPSKDQFMYVYDLVNGKNEENFIANGQKLNEFPTHWFTMNRWDTDHPLIEFAEEHAPWEAVKEWMLEDPENNNTYIHFVDQPKPGWEKLDKTMIVYMSKLANHIFCKDEVWKEKQLRLIAAGNPQDLGTVLGDAYEGVDTSLKSYHYSRADSITREEFKTDYAKYATFARIVIDLDFSRQIRIRPKYTLTKTINGVAIHRLIRDRAYSVPCNGVSVDGHKTEVYFQNTLKLLVKLCDGIRKEMPQIKNVIIIIDDKKAQWVSRLNYGAGHNPFWTARKVDFDQKWPIWMRPKLIDSAQDTGFIIDIKDESNDELHRSYHKSLLDEGATITKKRKKKPRVEKDRDKNVDDWNADEYGIYLEKMKLLINDRATYLLGGNNIWKQAQKF